ncbi:MAG TPA: heme biosynthesis HemY N-terminal domain-containing protein, partial [Stellaceae bacterium]|nr:heme biosynthesis HemY N-terminal domain-containing protein [Stellaceae bacterium]
MKGLLWLIVIAALAVALSLALSGNGGYALFVLPPWRAEISLNFLGLAVIAAFFLAYFLVRAVWHTLRLPSHVRAFRRRRRTDAGHEAILGAIQALFEGRFV